ncbi:MAG: hypothetical protein WBE20_13855 [Candidatus Acidiferrales bacterium]
MRIPEGKKIRRIFFAVLLALLLLVATTAGNIWHHHADASSESTCALCHLGHQPAQQPAVVRSALMLVAIGSSAVLADPISPLSPVGPRLAARAPPSSL